MRPSDQLRLLCLCLRPERSDQAQAELRARLKAGVDWVGLAAGANASLVAPSLWLSLERQGLLPDLPGDFRDYLAAIYRANSLRLEAMHAQARRAVAALNSRQITPVFLKGGARLFEAQTPSARARMMADLDLLVEEGLLEEAVAALARIGYAVTDEPGNRRSHSVTLRLPGEPAALDLHRDIGPQRDFIAPADAFSAAVPVVDGALSLRLLSPTHRVMHGFFHAQIHDRGHIAGIVPLRDLDDFVWIAQRHAAAIDWAAITQACERLRLAGAWHAWLELAEQCLGFSPEAGEKRHRVARLHYRRALFLLDHPSAASLLGIALALSEPLSYANIAYKYGCTGKKRDLLRARLIETAHLLGKYRHRFPQRLAAAVRERRERTS